MDALNKAGLQGSEALARANPQSYAQSFREALKNGASYDVVIMGLKENQPDINNCTKEELTEALDGRIYTTLRFCNMEALDTMIKLLQDTKKMWEADIHNRK